MSGTSLSVNLVILKSRFNLKNSNKNMALANLSTYYTWKNIESE